MSPSEVTTAEAAPASAGTRESTKTVSSESTSTNTPTNSPRVRWRVNYRNIETNDLVYEAFGDQEGDADVQGNLPQGEPSFEIIKLYHTKQEKEDSASKSDSKGPPPPAIHLGPPKYSISIHSEEIINALHSVVKYYPQVKLEESPLTLRFPYAMLCHHYDELEKFAITCRDRDPSTACDLEKNAYGHISLLLSYLDDCVMPQVRAEQELNRRGSYTWRWMWVGRKPGRTIFSRTREAEGWYASIIYDMTGGPWEDSNTWYIRYWNLEFDGEYLGRVLKEVDHDSWAGEGDLGEQMLLLNMAGDDTEPTDPTAQEAIRMGKLYWELAEGKCQWHSGKVVDFPHNEVSTSRFRLASSPVEGQGQPVLLITS
jgi:hypothetical protein